MNNFLHCMGSATILFSVLTIATISTLLSERVGILNIGVNGMMIVGAITFSTFSKLIGINSSLHWYWQIFALLFVCIISAIISLLHSFACITLKADQTVVGMAINIFASGLGLFFINIPGLSTGNNIVSSFQNIAIDKNKIFNLYLLIAIIIIVLIFVFFNFTRLGMNYKAIGENTHAAYAAGINIIKSQYISVTFSGILAGFAGALYIFYNSNIFAGNVQGMGYTALAILICGQWRIEIICIVSLFFSLLISATSNEWNILVSLNLLKTLPYILTIIFMIFISKYSKIPKSVGIPFII